jgi:SagB-type dehydrogenase family enzyme
MNDTSMENFRDFLKDTIRKKIDFSQTQQSRGVPAPPIQKPPSSDQTLIRLPDRREWTSVGDIPLVSAIENRKSRRIYTPEPLQMDELAFLLWACQGIRSLIDSGHALRTVPSAGCRHSFETYLLILNVAGMEPGLFRYLPVDHALVREGDAGGSLPERITAATFGQSFIGKAAAVFVWATLPHRMEWRYGPAAHRVIAMDAGHVCQNLYLACEAVGAGTCAVGAFDQEGMDRLAGVDGTDEFVIYLAPVGKVGA